jgi:hypothetical protein
LIHHNDDCQYTSFGATNTHLEMDTGLGCTRGYEVCVSDYGTLKLVGDGGYRNWTIGGSYSEAGDDVTFYSMNRI